MSYENICMNRTVSWSYRRHIVYTRAAFLVAREMHIGISVPMIGDYTAYKYISLYHTYFIHDR